MLTIPKIVLVEHVEIIIQRSLKQGGLVAARRQGRLFFQHESKTDLRPAARGNVRERRVENLCVGVRSGVIIGQLQGAVADFAPCQRAGFVRRIQLANLAEYLHGQLKIRQRLVGVRRFLQHQRAAVGEQGLRVQVRRTIRVARQ